MYLSGGYLLCDDADRQDAGEDAEADDDDVLDDGDLGEFVHLQLQVYHAGQDEGEQGAADSTCTEPDNISTVYIRCVRIV